MRSHGFGVLTMRGPVLLTALWITLVHAAMNGYTQARDPRLPTGSDDLPVTGDAGSAHIRATAIVTAEHADAAAQRRIEQDVVPVDGSASGGYAAVRGIAERN